MHFVEYPIERKQPQISFSVVEKQFCCRCGCGGRHTLEKLLSVFSWSMKCLLRNEFPSARHDESCFKDTDAARAVKSGEIFVGKALLMQVRGDWAWYKQIFSFHSWSSEQICWMCQATQETGDAPYTEVNDIARWRRKRYRRGEFWQCLRRQGIRPSSIFSLPGMSLDFCCIDILHALDLGVTQDAIGNLFHEYLRCGLLDGSTLELRLGSLIQEMRAHYDIAKTPNRISDLTMESIQEQGKTPKLKAKGAETRNLVPFAVECALRMHDHVNSLHSLTVAQMMSSLLDFYALMLLDEWNAELAIKACRSFCKFYVALGKEAKQNDKDIFWKPKPKLHMFMELVEYQAPTMGNPKLFWAYRDEDFVGYIAKLGHSRGGPKTHATVALQCLERFSMLQSMGE